MRKNKVDIITLGCSKNLVDSEQLMRQFVANGYTVEHDPHKINGEIVVVNTCGFIGDAQEESINMILELGEQKQKGRIGKLFVMGCLSERFLKDLEKELPEVDRFYGKFNWKELISDLGKSYHQELATERVLTTPRHYAYVKIGEGCNRTCSYCSIPIITGAYQSRPMDEIVDEVRGLVAQGVKEFQMIAQDLTFYGLDRYKRMALPELVERVSDIPGVEWIRLHYGYPSHFPYDLLPVMRERDNVCKYMDIALQHISDPMLKMMRRNITKAETYELLERMRREVPGIHLRTTLMVGHPGETEQDFEEAYQDIIDQNTPLFEKQTESLTTYQMNFLRAIIDGVHSEFTTQEVLQKYKLGSSANVSIVKRALVKKELIEIEKRQAIIPDPVMKVWLKRELGV